VAPSGATPATATSTKSTTTAPSSTPPGAVSTPDASSPNSNLSLPSTWSYSGCYIDTVNPRSLPNWSNFDGNEMSSTKCVAFCDSQGFSIAGTEYAGQCFCGDVLDTAKVDEGECDMPCTGASEEICGGSAVMSVFEKTLSSESSSTLSGSGQVGESRKRSVHVHRHARGLKFN